MHAKNLQLYAKKIKFNVKMCQKKFPVWIGVKIAPGGHGSFGGTVNIFIHIFMYSYYLLTSFGPKFKRFFWLKKYLTILQIAQFFVIILHSSLLLFVECDYPKILLVYSSAHTSVFLVLFLNFYRNAYRKQELYDGFYAKKSLNKIF